MLKVIKETKPVAPCLICEKRVKCERIRNKKDKRLDERAKTHNPWMPRKCISLARFQHMATEYDCELQLWGSATPTAAMEMEAEPKEKRQPKVPAPTPVPGT